MIAIVLTFRQATVARVSLGFVWVIFRLFGFAFRLRVFLRFTILRVFLGSSSGSLSSDSELKVLDSDSDPAGCGDGLDDKSEGLSPESELESLLDSSIALSLCNPLLRFRVSSTDILQLGSWTHLRCSCFCA